MPVHGPLPISYARLQFNQGGYVELFSRCFAPNLWPVHDQNEIEERIVLPCRPSSTPQFPLYRPTPNGRRGVSLNRIGIATAPFRSENSDTPESRPQEANRPYHRRPPKPNVPKPQIRRIHHRSFDDQTRRPVRCASASKLVEEPLLLFVTIDLPETNEPPARRVLHRSKPYSSSIGTLIFANQH